MKRSPLWFILLPFTFLYGMIIWIRNGLFNYGILPQKSYEPCILLVGNLSVGGTGKTPHLIAIAKLLKDDYSLAILSRGYKRKSKGFRWILSDDHPDMSGDEPLEIKTRLRDIPVAVCADRRKGIETIINSLDPVPQIILLDDGFQHRYIKPDFSLILTRQDSLFSNDGLLPSGRLREHKRAIKRAQSICVSHSSENIDINNLRKELKLSDTQMLITSRIEYPLLENKSISPESHILLISSIAHPDPIFSKLESSFKKITHLRYRDHYSYTEKDIQKIISTFNSISDNEKIIITTGKDIVKLNQFEQFRSLPHKCAEIEVIFNRGDDQKLLNEIKAYVE